MVAENTIVVTRHCVYCNKPSEVTVDAYQYADWTHGKGHIQTLMSDLPADQREILISGTHPECWEKMWAEGEE